jgi:zinc protease
MFKATKNRPEGEFDRIMEGLGAQTNASTWVDWTNYHAKVPAWDLPIVCALEADRMANLALDADMLEREREVVANERVMRVDDDPDGMMAEALYRAIFPAHPYGEPTIGWMEDIRAIDLSDCNYFYNTWYSPSNAVIVVCGDFEPAAVLALVRDHYGALPAVELPTETPPPALPPTDSEVVVTRAAVQAPRFTWAWRGPASGTREHAALELAAEILAGSDSAPLVMTLVEDSEVATDVSAWVTPWALGSVFEINVTLRPDADPEAALELAEETIAAAIMRKPTDDELERARNGLETDFWRGLADVNARANQLGHCHVTVGDYRETWLEAERLATTTSNEVAASMARWLRPENLTRGRLEPLEGVDDGDEDAFDDDDATEDEA